MPGKTSGKAAKHDLTCELTTDDHHVFISYSKLKFPKNPTDVQADSHSTTSRCRGLGSIYGVIPRDGPAPEARKTPALAQKPFLHHPLDFKDYY